MALTLSRKVGEVIVIGKDIRIEVTRIKANRYGRSEVRLAIDAPKDMSVDREEVRMRKESNE